MGKKRGRNRRNEAADHEEKYREEGVEEDETAYFDESPEAPGPSAPSKGRKEHTHVDESAYMGEEPEAKAPSARRIHPEIEEKRPEKADRAPAPGIPDFWPSSEIGIDEDWTPPIRNRPASSPWMRKGELEEAEKQE